MGLFTQYLRVNYDLLNIDAKYLSGGHRFLGESQRAEKKQYRHESRQENTPPRLPIVYPYEPRNAGRGESCIQSLCRLNRSVASHNQTALTAVGHGT